jgi:hypothetical protein
VFVGCRNRRNKITPPASGAVGGGSQACGRDNHNKGLHVRSTLRWRFIIVRLDWRVVADSGDWVRPSRDARALECFPTYKGEPAVLLQLAALVRERFTFGLPVSYHELRICPLRHDEADKPGCAGVCSSPGSWPTRITTSSREPMSSTTYSTTQGNAKRRARSRGRCTSKSPMPERESDARSRRRRGVGVCAQEARGSTNRTRGATGYVEAWASERRARLILVLLWPAGKATMPS